MRRSEFPVGRPNAPDANASPAIHMIGTLMIAWILAYLDRMIIAMLIPSLKSDLDISDTQASLLQGFAFALFFVLAGLSIGRLVDRYNRRNIIISGVVFWSTATIGCGLASSFGELFVARLGVGIGEACLAPATMSLLADYCAPGKSGRAIGIVTAGAPLGAAGSSFVGGLLLDLFAGQAQTFPLLGTLQPWQMVFICLGAPGYAVALAVLTINEPARRSGGGQSDSSFLSFARSLIASRSAMLPLFAYLACNFVVATGFAAWVAVAMMRTFGFTPGQAGSSIGGILLVSGSVGSILGGRISDALLSRWPLDGRLRIAWLTYPVIIIAIAIFSMATTPLIGLAAVALFFVASNMVHAASFPTVVEIFTEDMRGQGVALYLLIGNIAGYGISGTLIALATDHLYHDELMVRTAMATVCLPFAILAVSFGTLAMKAYADRRARLLDEGL